VRGIGSFNDKIFDVGVDFTCQYKRQIKNQSVLQLDDLKCLEITDLS
jgi:hypothetical protein